MSRYRLLFLFLLLAVILTSAVIGWFGWKAIVAQTERDENSVQEWQHQQAAEIGRDLLGLLKDIELGAVKQESWRIEDAAEMGVVLMGSVEGGRLIYPWDAENIKAEAEAFRRSISAPEFADRKTKADQANLSKDYEREVEIYESIAQSVSDPNQRVFARLLLAGAYMRARHGSEGLNLYRDLLKLPSDVVDEGGVPLALDRDYYVVKELLAAHSAAIEREVLDRANREIDSLPALARTAGRVSQILDELAARSGNASVRADALATKERLQRQIDYMERMRALPQARHLQESFESSSMGLTAQTWKAFPGEELWLIGMTSREGRPLVIAVRSEEMRKRLADDRHQALEFATGGESLLTLHENLPGLGLVPLSAPPPEPNLLPILFAVALAFVGLLLPASLWLLWRDMQRGVHLAELRSQFVSSVSHELKTPLTAIRMLAETLRMRPTSPQKHAQYLDTIVSESERLSRLLNNVLDFSRIERGQKNYHLQPAVLADVVQSAAQTMRFPLAQQGFSFHVDTDAQIPPLPVDRDALEQAVLNLLSNAIKYSAESREIALRLCRQNGHALIQVEDHGVGIAAEQQKRIFEKFYRVPTAENREISGTGLGLALVAHIAEAHGGSVEVESALGRGSTFSIRIPIATEETGGHRPPLQKSRPSVGAVYDRPNGAQS